MKYLSLITFMAAAMIGCSDPEVEANKLFTEASKLIREADDIKQQEIQDVFNVCQKQKRALELIETITTMYPGSSLSVKISEGGFKLRQRSIEQIKETLLKKLDKLYFRGLDAGRLEVVKKCLKLGMDLNSVNDLTPLSIASRNGFVEIVKLLINEGAKVDAINKGFQFGSQGVTPLHDAVENGHLDIVKLLISNGADPKTKELLDVAVSNGHTDIVKLLISNGADPKTRGILNIAASKGHMDIFKLLLNNTDAAEILSKKIIDARITEQNSFGSILHHENIIRDKDMLKSLIEKGFDVNAKDQAGESPLHKAAFKGFNEVVDLLISEGANINAKDNIDWTPLHNAASGGQKRICELLISQGADIHAKDRNGSTPLDAAENLFEWDSEERKFEETTTTILEAKSQTAKFLREKGGKTSEWLKTRESIHITARDGNIEAVKQLLAAGTDVNATDEAGSTPLHMAASGGHKEVAELLIAKGADVNAKFSFKGTSEYTWREYGSAPLHDAAYWGHKEVAELLIAKGADVNAKNNFGKTPLDRAIQQNPPGFADLIRKHGGKTGEELKAEGK